MELDYVWDTNAVIYYLQTHITLSVKLFLNDIIDSNQPIISVITEIELLVWRTSVKKDINLVKDFIVDCRVADLDEYVKLKTIEIRKYFRLKLPDAIIAATTLVYDKTLITRNSADFSKIPGIKLVNPFEA